MNPIHIQKSHFKDHHNRILNLRGVNLGGSTKVPVAPDGATYIPDDFMDHRAVSFVGRPFPLAEADEHFSRLASWGYTFLRFLVTWEAIEHAGPGEYDQDYLDYLYQVIEKAAEHDIHVFIDPHQDVWSRFSGGDGAPGWTFEIIGMDITKLDATGAAITHQQQGDPFPRMIWPTNTTKLAAATMFTLFFGGNDFAPHTTYNGIPIQDFLQEHYINALKQVALKLKPLPNVVGFDTMNEPLQGYIEWDDLGKAHALVEMGTIPSPFESMQLGSGLPLELDVWQRQLTGPKIVGKKILNPDGVSVWLEGFDCIWQQHGVWGPNAAGQPKLLLPDYFTQVNDRAVDFNRDYYMPFNNKFAAAMRNVMPDTIIFIEEPLDGKTPSWQVGDADNIAFAPHWYDALVLFMQAFTPWLGYDRGKDKVVLGRRNVRKSFADQLSRLKRKSRAKVNNAPVLVGETGIAYNLNRKEAYRSGDFSKQIKAMDRTMVALEDNLLNFTLWNYTADNTNERGDLWNDEDLSIFSRDQQDNPADINSGGRALQAVVRPYAIATAGQPLSQRFDIKSRVFKFSFQSSPDIDAPTVFYLPNYQYPEGYQVTLSAGTYTADPEKQRLYVTAQGVDEVIRVIVRPEKKR